MVLRMIQRLHVLADPPNMVDLIREERLSCTLTEAIENNWWLNDNSSPWRRKAAELCKSSGKINLVKKLLLKDLHSNEKAIVVTDFPVVSELIYLVCPPHAKMRYLLCYT